MTGNILDTIDERYSMVQTDAKLVWLDGGHFALEENVPLVAAEITAMFSDKIAAV